MCGLVYVRFEKVDIHTVLMGTPCSVLYSSLKNNWLSLASKVANEVGVNLKMASTSFVFKKETFPKTSWLRFRLNTRTSHVHLGSCSTPPNRTRREKKTRKSSRKARARSWVGRTPSTTLHPIWPISIHPGCHASLCSTREDDTPNNFLRNPWGIDCWLQR